MAIITKPKMKKKMKKEKKGDAMYALVISGGICVICGISCGICVIPDFCVYSLNYYNL